MSNFEQASRMKLRFDTPKGLLSAEDLWDLPLTSAKGANLDDIARGLHIELRSGNDVSFVAPTQRADTTLQLRFDVVKHVIDTRLAENAAATNAAAAREKKQKLLALIEAKEGESLSQMSIDQLRAMVNGM